MKRRGFGDEVVSALKEAHRKVYRSSFTVAEAVASLADLRTEYEQVDEFVSGVESSQWGIVRPRG